MRFQTTSPRPCAFHDTYCYIGKTYHVLEAECPCTDGYRTDCLVPQHASRARCAAAAAAPTFEEIEDVSSPGGHALALRPVGTVQVDALGRLHNARFEDFGRSIEQAWILPLSCRKALAEAGARARPRADVVDAEKAAESRAARFQDEAFRLLLGALMVNDPAPSAVADRELRSLIERESDARGFKDWIGAYHTYNAETDSHDPHVETPEAIEAIGRIQKTLPARGRDRLLLMALAERLERGLPLSARKELARAGVRARPRAGVAVVEDAFDDLETGPTDTADVRQNRQPEHWIATDAEHTMIYGIGHTQAEAMDDALMSEPAGTYLTMKCTSVLYGRVLRDGGGPDVHWQAVRVCGEDAAMLATDY